MYRFVHPLSAHTVFPLPSCHFLSWINQISLYFKFTAFIFLPCWLFILPSPSLLTSLCIFSSSFKLFVNLSVLRPISTSHHTVIILSAVIFAINFSLRPLILILHSPSSFLLSSSFSSAFFTLLLSHEERSCLFQSLFRFLDLSPAHYKSFTDIPPRWKEAKQRWSPQPWRIACTWVNLKINKSGSYFTKP